MRGGMAIAFLALVGCAPADGADSGSGTGERVPFAQAAMTVHRDPNCGCCEAWAEIASKAGYKVTVVQHDDMTAVKQRLGVPADLGSCHTVEVGGYVLEGHVPMDQVARLLREKPGDIAGIAVPGMPLGSPGMEVPDGTVDEYQVIAFDRVGNARVYRA